MRTLTAALLLAAAPLAQAHDLWIERAGDLHTLHYGHLHGSHAGAGRIAYPATALRRARCFDAEGRPLPVEQAQGTPATLKGPCASSLFELAGYWSKTPYETRNLPRDQAGGLVIESWLALESVLRLDGPGPVRPLGEGLEILPVGDPRGVAVGEKLTVAVYFDGRPLAGATVAYLGNPRGTTDSQGTLNLRLRQPGTALIAASFTRPLAGDGRAEKEIHTATLQFEVGE